MTTNMRNIVREGYEKGDYPGHFRLSSEPNHIEQKYLDRLANHLPEKATILDLGCGTGVPFDSYLVQKGFSVTGIDFATNHVKQARENVPEATFIEGDFSKMDFENERFHAIIAMYSIFHIPREEQPMLLQKMYALLEKYGNILITLWTSNT